MERESLTRARPFEAEPVEIDAAALEVYCWRMEQLLRAGYDRMLADVIAENLEVDLHQACELLRRGCHQLTASRILL
jgi:hypothetical protein